MSPGANRIPLPLHEILDRVKLPGKIVPAAEAAVRASPRRQLVQDFQPLAHSLEWQLAELHWLSEGVLPFVDSNVPYIANNDGRLSADAAALLFENCQECAGSEGPIRVLEIGAGTGLFARYFLDEFRGLSERASRDFYKRLTYYVTDRSPKTVEQWKERDIFAEHGPHVVALASHASAATGAVPGPLRAAFCNYVLDVLPAAVVRKTDAGWQELAMRAWLPDDAALLRAYTRLTFDQIRSLVGTEDLSRLLPILPVLESEAEFQAMAGSWAPVLEEVSDHLSGGAFVYNYAAIECLRSLCDALDPAGFLLVNDYVPAPHADPAQGPRAQRFGPSTALGLNFPLAERLVCGPDFEVCIPEGDDRQMLHARLFLSPGMLETRRVFHSRFAASTLEQAEATAAGARQAAERGYWRAALEYYQAAIEANPRNWQLIGEAADFVVTQLRDDTAGIELAQAGLALNPWYSPFLWNVLGDALVCRGDAAAAHECYLQAHRIHPADVKTNLKLAQSWRLLGDPQRSLEAVARGLANDSGSMFRHRLLEEQQQTIGLLSLRWNAEREVAARRGC